MNLSYPVHDSAASVETVK